MVALPGKTIINGASIPDLTTKLQWELNDGILSRDIIQNNRRSYLPQVVSFELLLRGKQLGLAYFPSLLLKDLHFEGSC